MTSETCINEREYPLRLGYSLSFMHFQRLTLRNYVWAVWIPITMDRCTFLSAHFRLFTIFSLCICRAHLKLNVHTHKVLFHSLLGQINRNNAITNFYAIGTIFAWYSERNEYSAKNKGECLWTGRLNTAWASLEPIGNEEIGRNDKSYEGHSSDIAYRSRSKFMSDVQEVTRVLRIEDWIQERIATKSWHWANLTRRALSP